MDLVLTFPLWNLPRLIVQPLKLPQTSTSDAPGCPHDTQAISGSRARGVWRCLHACRPALPRGKHSRWKQKVPVFVVPVPSPVLHLPSLPDGRLLNENVSWGAGKGENRSSFQLPLQGVSSTSQSEPVGNWFKLFLLKKKNLHIYLYLCSLSVRRRWWSYPLFFFKLSLHANFSDSDNILSLLITIFIKNRRVRTAR